MIQIFHAVPYGSRTYKYIGTLQANLTNFFELSQNFDWNIEYVSFGVRSTSVGDIILHDSIFYLIEGMGLKELQNFVFHLDDSSDTQGI